MKRTALGLVLVVVSAFARAQEEDRLWMPEGYRLLTEEERQAISTEELKAIGTRNAEVMLQAIRTATPEERRAIATHLEEFGRKHELTAIQKQYVTMTSMTLMAVPVGEQDEARQAEAKARFDKLVREQEAATRGFPDDTEKVEAEARDIQARARTGTAADLYLPALRVLRARPSNRWARWTLHRIVEIDPRVMSKQPVSLYDAALLFFRARQAENPEEGAWYSIEALLRLTVREEVAEAKRLFALANARNARDIDSRLFPLLIAEIENDSAEVARLTPRAREAWPKQEDLDRSLFEGLGYLPGPLQARARETFERRYRAQHPTDWDSRFRNVFLDASAARWREVEGETTALLALPATTLPEPYRTRFLAMKLRAKSALGKCDEVSPEIARLEASAEAAYPRAEDPNSPPAQRTAAEVRQLRAELARQRAAIEKLRTSLADGSLERSAEWGALPAEERHARAEEWIASLAKEISDRESTIRNPDDAAAAAAWSRLEMANWQKERGISPDVITDLAGWAEHRSIEVRSAQGKCLLAKGRPAEAARVLSPCVSNGPSFHHDCVMPLLEAASALVSAGRVAEAAAIYEQIAPSRNYAGAAAKLYSEIEKAAPGTIKRREPLPSSAP